MASRTRDGQNGREIRMKGKIPAVERKAGLFSTTKAILEFAALWTGFGYFSLRAFCNFSGVPLPSNLGPEAYIHESYTFIVDTVLEIFTSALFLLFLMLGGLGILILPKHWFDAVRSAARRSFESRAIAWFFSLFLLVITFFFGQINKYLMAMGSRASITGPLSSEFLGRISSNYYYWTLLLAFFSWACFLILRSHQRSQARSSIPVFTCLKAAFLVFGILATLYLPIVYATSLKSGRYYIVKFSLSDKQSPVCALRLLETSSHLFYWHAENGVGQLESVPISRVAATSYLRVDNIFRLAQEAAETNVAEPRNCGATGLSGGHP